MLLKHLYLFLSLEEYSEDVVIPFSFHTRYICNFLERHLRALKFVTADFSKICVQGCSAPQDGCPVVPENAALSQVTFDRQRYSALTPDETHEFYIAMLLEGLEKCARYQEIPLREMRAAIVEFQRGGYRNEWIHKRKMLRPIGMRATLRCVLDANRFALTLELQERELCLFKREILETKPDEMIFGYQFKDVVLEDGLVVVKDRLGRPTFSLALDDIRR